MDRRNYRWTDRLDCSERAIANITLSSDVELRLNEQVECLARIIIPILDLSRNRTGRAAPILGQDSPGNNRTIYH